MYQVRAIHLARVQPMLPQSLIMTLLWTHSSQHLVWVVHTFIEGYVYSLQHCLARSLFWFSALLSGWLLTAAYQSCFYSTVCSTFCSALLFLLRCLLYRRSTVCSTLLPGLVCATVCCLLAFYDESTQYIHALQLHTSTSSWFGISTDVNLTLGSHVLQAFITCPLKTSCEMRVYESMHAISKLIMFIQIDRLFPARVCRESSGIVRYKVDQIKKKSVSLTSSWY
jgi:hypothetical protein